MQPVATNLVTERIRDRLDLLDRSEGHRLRRRVPLEDRLIHRDDPRDLRLVLQDLGDEDRVWVARSAPGKIATVWRVLGEVAALEGAAAAPAFTRPGPFARSGRGRGLRQRRSRPCAAYQARTRRWKERRRPRLYGDRDLLREVAGGAMVACLLFKRRLEVSAGGRHLGDWATRMEAAAGRRIHRRWDLAFGGA